MPDSRSSTAVPEARTVSTSSFRSTSRGAGDSSGVERPSSRSRPRTTRSSSWAVRPILSIDSSAPDASSGRLAMSRLPTPAWTVMTARVWATTSCSSWAMRTRSSRTCWRARSVSAVCSRLCCSASPSWYRRRAATASPTNQAAPSGTRPSIASSASGADRLLNVAYTSAPPITSATTMVAVMETRRVSCEETR